MTGLLLALAFLAGFILHDSGAGLGVVLLILVAAILTFMLTTDRSERALLVLSIVCLFLGAWRAQTGIVHPDNVFVPVTSGDRSIVARVVGRPAQTSKRTEATIELQALPDKTVVATLPLVPVVSEGDTIRFFAPAAWTTPDGRHVLIPRSNRGQVFVPSFEILSTSTSPPLRARTFVDRFTAESIERHISEPEASLTLGIMTGDDSGMTSATVASFRAAGMSQITAVSGWNVAILAGFIALLLRRLWPTGVVPTMLAIGTIWAYAYLVGMEPSVVRAAGMATTILLAHLRGRPGDLLTSLLLTTAVFVAITPSIRLDIGFQFSVAATLGIVLLLERGRSRSWWYSTLAVPFVAELAIAPLLLHHLGAYSLLSPMANLITAPLVELVMFGGLTTLVGAAIHPAIGSLFGILTWVPAHLILAVATKTASVSWSTSTTETIGWSTTFGIYAAMLLVYWGIVSWSGARPAALGKMETTSAI